MAKSEYSDGSIGRPTKSRPKAKRMASAWVRMHGSNVERQDYNKASPLRQRELAHNIRCRFCGHKYHEHAMSQHQPYVLDRRKAMEQRILTKYVEITDLQCQTCASDKGTTLVQCYTETVGVGEIVPKPDQTAALSGRH